MIAFAVLSGPLPKLGVIGVGLLAGAVITVGDPVRRAWAMLGALVLAPVLLLASIWNSPQLGIVHRHPLELAVGAVVILAVLAGAARLLAGRARLLAPLAMFALPFRIPIQAGGSTANLLVPLYLVVAAGCLAWLVPVLWRTRSGSRPSARKRSRAAGAPAPGPPAAGAAPPASAAPAGPHLFEKVLAGYVVLYAIQAVYSADFQKALQNMVFFYVPFALLLAMLRELRWDRELLTRCLGVSAALAVVFACIGYVEYATKTLLLNPQLIARLDVHPYFTVNSVFFDPDIFGRYLALVMILLAAVLLHERRPRLQIGVSVVLAMLWAGLVLTLSRSSLGALLVGLAVLAALRWKVWPVLSLGAAVVVAGLIALAISPSTFGLNQGLNGASSGRAHLITGGARMFAQRPIYGYGSGAFVVQYRRENKHVNTTLAASHTIPVTIAAEQGLIGEIVYLVLVVTALITLFRGTRRRPERAAIAATFLALLLHTMLYADFLEDPTTWVLLAIGGAMAWQQQRGPERAGPEAERGRRRTVTSAA
ncbi:MAG TPA: O-antigen ligase family protein [Solirubrobacteraceae bacterium]|nr:O-antigen ligase family protein [Solirubrobacteraceae bacterium]